MKARSGYIRLPKMEYRDLLPVYKDIYKKYLEETRQDESTDEAIVHLETSLIDIKKNKKPAGFNKPGNVRFIFPIKDQVAIKNEGIEFYFYRNVKSQDVVTITQKISTLLKEKGIEHSVIFDNALGNTKRK